MCFAKKFELESRVFPFKTSSLKAGKHRLVNVRIVSSDPRDAYPMIRQPAVLAGAKQDQRMTNTGMKEDSPDILALT